MGDFVLHVVTSATHAAGHAPLFVVATVWQMIAKTGLYAGAMRLPLGPFVALGTAGRMIRFTAVVLAPRLLAT